MIKKIVKDSRVIFIAAVIVLSTLVVSANTNETQTNHPPILDDEWVMEIENTVAEPGEIGHTIPINGVWLEDIKLYVLRIEYDPEMIEVTEVNVDGCVGENGEANPSYYDNYFTLVLSIPYDPIPAGEGKLANLVVNITDDEGTTELNFSDSGNLYVNYDSKVRYPTLYNGIITIISSQIAIESISGGLFFVKVDIKNIGDEDLTDVPWSINLDGGLIILGGETTGTVDIPTGETVTIRSSLILGFGKTEITVIAEIAEETVAGAVLLFFILLS